MPGTAQNDGVLPFDRSAVKTVGVFGKGADTVPVGDNYSGPYQGWRADDAYTPLGYLKEFLGGVKIITGTDEQIPRLAPGCDICLYFTKMLEGEGRDRCNIRLSAEKRTFEAENTGGMIVDQAKAEQGTDQESAIVAMAKANGNCAVILLNGAPVDMTPWIDSVPAVLEAWYPGEQGAQAICEALFGLIDPCGKTPMSFPKSVGQLPLYYSFKPSGRGYHYNENDGKPLFEFGFGLSYTQFRIDNASVSAQENELTVEYDIENTGKYEGAQVVQIYLQSRNCGVVRPVSELKAYRKTRLDPGEKKRVAIKLGAEAFSYYDEALDYGMFDGDHTVMLGVSCSKILQTFEVSIRDGRLYVG
ncbi:MAG: glycoside hydrolase family 3 C-terminal domain-containing protein [Clostridia bacterium]|nr:glycoside hydrolase family 3 C-terminal domain-containing protein [Clostridia bacterium]